MKRKITAFFTLFLSAVLSILCFASCGNDGKTKSVVLEKVTETMIVMRVEEAEENASALSALTKLKEDGALTFETKDSGYGAYIVSINGKEEIASGNSGYSWMLYTSDAEHSSTEFGSVEYNGAVYGSSALGASSLIVKDGGIYIWVYESWSF